ncbi:MAG: NUDIX hydrolase [Phycisphaerae bacterium]
MSDSTSQHLRSTVAAVIHTSPKFRVEHCTMTLPDGGVHEYDQIAHAGAAVLLPVLDDGRVVLIHNYRYTVGRELLELPAGTLDADESPEVCAARELTEETGYRAAALRHLVSFYATPGFCTERMHVYVATGLTAGEARREKGELIRLAPQSLDDALSFIRDGVIVDAKTMVAILYYARFGVTGAGEASPQGGSR